MGIHCIKDNAIFRSLLIVGNAKFNIVLSTTSANWPEAIPINEMNSCNIG